LVNGKINVTKAIVEEEMKNRTKNESGSRDRAVCASAEVLRAQFALT